MKFLIVFVVLVAAVYAEPPRYRMRYLERQQEDAPYPAAGFRPAGQQFYLPARQTQEVEEPVPRTIYGPPTTEEVPTTTDIITTEEPTTTLRPFSSQINEAKVKPEEEDKPEEEEHEIEEAQENEATEIPNEDDANDEVEELEGTNVQPPPHPQANGQEGIYYVLLQNGQLQKVQYATTVNDVRNMAYSTQLRYENVQPISGPVYTFSPENQLYQVVF